VIFVLYFCKKNFRMAEKYLESLMEKQVRVTLPDQRVVEGSLHCVDSGSNLILHDVKISLKDTVCQMLPSVMVNGKTIVKFEVFRSTDTT